VNSSQLTPADLANRYGFPSLANELRLHINPSSSSSSSTMNKQIHLENATIVRLVVKRRNVNRCDASNQVNENELISNIPLIPPKKLTNKRFDLSELQARVKEHEVIRRDTTSNGDQDSNVLMHSMDSLNQQNKTRQRAKLPSQTYAPWLKMGNMTPQVFHQEIQ
jgi:hypothetical protein